MTTTFNQALQITLNGRLEHLRGIALGFRNLAHYIARSLVDSGGFRPLFHFYLLEACYIAVSGACVAPARRCESVDSSA